MTIVLGACVELIQGTIPWRTKETADIVANSIGTVVALALWKIG